MSGKDSRLFSIHAAVSFSDALSRDRVIVPDNVWQSLLFIYEHELPVSANMKIAVSLAFHGSESHAHQHLARRTAWALLPEASQPAPTPDTIIVSRLLSHELLLDIEPLLCSMTVVSPVHLTELAVIASHYVSHGPAEDLSQTEQLVFSGDRILRTGDVLSKGSIENLANDACTAATGSHCRLEIAMTKPVLQGFVDPSKTRIFFATGETIADSPSPARINAMDSSSLNNEHDDETFTIDENFFASSTLRNGTNALPLRKHANKDGGGPTTSHFCAIPLSRRPLHDFNESYTMYMLTEDLGKLGIFNGDWCIAGSSNGNSRFVRVSGVDAYSAVRFDGFNRGIVYGSPQLLNNCGLSLHGRDFLSIRASSFGSSSTMIPTARSATLARIASPLSLDKTYYSAMLGSLKEKLDTSRFLVKIGDIITVTVSKIGTSEPDNDGGDAYTQSGSSDMLRKRMVAENYQAYGDVHFVVSSLEYDAFRPDDHESDPGARPESACGEMGCWIDSTATRVIQTGLEHRFAPRSQLTLSADLEVDGFRNCFRKICDVASVACEETAASLGLGLVVLLKGPSNSAMHATCSAVASLLGFHLLDVSAYDIIGESQSKTEVRLKEEFDVAMSCSPCIFLLRDIDGLLQSTHTEMDKDQSILHVYRECTDNLVMNWRQMGFPVLVIATSNSERLSPQVLACFKHEIVFEAPDESERFALLNSLIHGDALGADISLKELAVHSAAFTVDDVIDLVSLMRLVATERSMEELAPRRCEDIATIHAGELILTEDSFNSAIEKARTSFSRDIGAPSIPKVSWNDVGGLASVKQDILDTIQLPLDNPELFADGLKQRSGILLYGPPGTGKTLLAKAVATSCSLNFFSVKGPELLNMYIGESEANVRRVFQQAREAKPCVIFFDELDSIAPKRGNHGDSGGVMDRIVSQLLAELDGMSSTKAGADVFVIGATNRPDLLDPALLRPGRFDRLLYLGVSDTHEAQLDILEALTRRFHLDPQLDLISIAEQCPFNFTGADFYALCSDAMLKAMTRKAELVEESIIRLNVGPHDPNHQYPLTPQYYLSEIASPSETNIIVSVIDFQEALQELVPSVSREEMNHYMEIQKRFNKSFLTASEQASE